MIKIYEPLFCTDVVVTLKNDRGILSAYMQTEDITKKGTTYRQYRINLENKDDFYSLIHETLHLTKQIMIDRGIPFNDENHEVIAYLQTYWFKKIWRKINRTKRQTKK